MSLFFKQVFAQESKSDLQTVGLFAVLAILTLMFVFLVKAVQFSPNANPAVELKPAAEAKISP